MKFLFYVSKKYSIPIVLPIINYLRDTEHTLLLYASDKVEFALPKELVNETIGQDITRAINFKPDFVLCPGNFVDFRIPGIKVQLFHGLGVEKKSHYKIRHFFDVYCTSGPCVTNRFEKLQKKYKYFLVRETGWPKVDHILNYPTLNLYKKFNIPKQKKIILFAPTHSNKLQSAEKLLPFISELIHDDELWFIKFHELMNNEIVKSFEHENVRIIDQYDITPYLHLADLLISDTSSVVYEFMLLDKPVITLDTVSRTDKGINIKKTDQLRSAIDRSLANPTEFSDKRRKHLAEVNPYRDADISKRLISTLKEIKVQNLLPEHKKPLNLFRKLQILYHAKFKQGYLR